MVEFPLISLLHVGRDQARIQAGANPAPPS
jgi:hypothetical protein